MTEYNNGINPEKANNPLYNRNLSGTEGNTPEDDIRSVSIWTGSENSVYLNKGAAKELEKNGFKPDKDYEDLNVYLCNGHSDYYTKKDKSVKEKLSHFQEKEIEKTSKEIIKSPGSINMGNIGRTLKLIDDSRDAGKEKNAAKLQTIVNNVISKSGNYKSARIFDGTGKNQQPPELTGIINAEDAQRYYDSEQGKSALDEIGAKNIRTQNNQTLATLENSDCKLEMNENGTLRFSFVKENGAAVAMEYELREKPVIPAAKVPKTPEKPHEVEPEKEQKIQEGKKVTYKKMQDKNGAANGDARSKEAQNLESSSAKRLNEKEGREILKQYANELNINIDDYEFITTGNPSFKKKNADEFISVNDKGQIIRTFTKATENEGEYEFISQEYKY